MILTAVAAVLAGCLYVILECSDYVPNRRTRTKVCGALAAAIAASFLLAPSAYEGPVEWYARRKAQEIQEIVEDLSPDTSVATAPAD